jgi:two-component system sensor histidine kinase UhpB
MDLVNISSRIEENQEKTDYRSIIEKMEQMERRIDNTIDTLRRIITEIRPGILDDLGLIPAIDWLVEVFRKKSDIKFHFNSNVEDSYLGKSRDTAVFRIIQESLTNVVRHSGAREAIVKIIKSGNYFEMKISDDGLGIDDEKLYANTSFGLMGMRERAETLGFEFNIEGIKDKGTIIKMKLPITEQ